MTLYFTENRISLLLCIIFTIQIPAKMQHNRKNNIILTIQILTGMQHNGKNENKGSCSKSIIEANTKQKIMV